MTIAELHGKISPHRSQVLHDRVEDLLTSDIFGSMKYARWQCLSSEPHGQIADFDRE